MMDTVGNKVARAEIAMIKVYVPNVAQQVMDWAIQAHGGGGVSDDFPIARMFAWNRVLRLVDGPDEVHRNAIRNAWRSTSRRRRRPRLACGSGLGGGTGWGARPPRPRLEAGPARRRGKPPGARRISAQ